MNVKTGTAAIDEATETGIESAAEDEDAMTTGGIAEVIYSRIAEEVDVTITGVAVKSGMSLRNRLEAVEVHHPRNASPPPILQTSPAFSTARDD